MSETAYDVLKGICGNLKKHKKGMMTYRNDEGQNEVEISIINCKPVIANLEGVYGSTETLGQMALDVLAVSGELNMNISLQVKDSFDIDRDVDFARIHLEYCGFYPGSPTH